MNDYVKSQYDISNWEFDFTFLTKEELEYAHKYLTNYMWSKFKCYDKEIIHKTILRAYRHADMYDPSKSNKWTWMSSILRNVYLSKDSLSNNIRKTMSLDDKIPGYNKGDKSFSELLPEVESDEDDGMDVITGEILWIIENGKYPLLQKRIKGIPYKDIARDMGMNLVGVKNGIYLERKVLRKHLIEFGDENVVSHIKSRKRNGKTKKG